MGEVDHHYERVMRDAKENVFLVAARQSIDTRRITVEFDAGRGPGPYSEHTLTVSIPGSPLSVVSYGIPHEWLPLYTNFVDTRLSRLVGGLLMDLVEKVDEAGQSSLRGNVVD